jgi:hypothetical protein
MEAGCGDAHSTYGMFTVNANYTITGMINFE